MIIKNVWRKVDILNNLPMCVCGQPHIFLAQVCRILRAILDHNLARARATAKELTNGTIVEYDVEEHRARLTELCGEDTSPAFWCWMYWLDNAGLTEHGGCVSSCWLTPDGEELVELFEFIDDGNPATWAKELDRFKEYGAKNV